MPLWLLPPLFVALTVYSLCFAPRTVLLEVREGRRIHLKVSPYAAVLRVDKVVVARRRRPELLRPLRFSHTTDDGLEITAGQHFDGSGRLEPYIEVRPGAPAALTGPASASRMASPGRSHAEPPGAV